MKYEKYKKKCDDKTSTWHYFLRAEDGGTGKCNLCQKIIKTIGGSTSGMRVHLKSAHSINIPSEKRPEVEVSEPQPGTSFAPTSGSVGPKKRKITEYFQSSNSLEATVSRMAARDGLPFAKFCTSPDLRRLFKKAGYDKLPSTPRSIKNIVMNYSKKEKKILIAELKELKKSGAKFSLTFDEWTSSRNRRYLNVNVHTSTQFEDGSTFKNLGLVRTTTCIRLLSEKLSAFELSLDDDIVAITTDGASVMCKVGRDIDAWHQLCLAHGIQLGVVDVLYAQNNVTEQVISMNNEDDDDDDSDVEDTQGFAVEYDESCIRSFSINPHYREIIIKVRKVVKLFTKSSTKNDDYLQKYVKQQEGKNLALILDCKTRWSSMADMIQRFNRLKLCVRKALMDLNSDISFSDEELETLNGIQQSLTVIKATVEALCRRDANLITAHAAIKFMLKKLKSQDTTLSKKLVESLRTRILQRRTPLPSILQYLQNPEAYFNDQNAVGITERGLTYEMNSQEITSEMLKLIKRFQSSPRDNPATPTDTANTSCASDESAGPCSIEKELNKEIEKSLQEKDCIQEQGRESNAHDDESFFKLLRIEMTLYENGGKRGHFLEEVYKYLMTIPPTSVESERAFSAANYVCNKIRSSLNDDTLDALCFLRSIFQQQNPPKDA